MASEARIERDLTRLVIGLAIILAGVVFTLDNLNLVEAGDFLGYWPVILIAIGVARIAQTSSWGSFGWSLVWLVAGLWLLGEKIGLVTISIWKLWPLALVVIGASILWRAYRPPQGCCTESRPADDLIDPTIALGGTPPPPRAAGPPRSSFVKAAAVMGAIERMTDSADFRGADLVAFMGACELDLRHARIAGDTAVVDVLALMGGIEIYVPDTWAIEAKVFPLMGGMGDETHLNTSGPTKRLVVRGLAIMGGIEIKN